MGRGGGGGGGGALETPLAFTHTGLLSTAGTNQTKLELASAWAGSVDTSFTAVLSRNDRCTLTVSCEH